MLWWAQVVLALREVVLQVSAWVQVVRVLLEQASRVWERRSYNLCI